MKTLKLFSRGLDSVPAVTSWYLSDLGEFKGRQELFARQSPQRLKALREHAIIESAVSSNRIEGVEVENKRIGTILFGKSHLREHSVEGRSGILESPRGEKTSMILRFIKKARRSFRVANIQKECPHVSVDMIRQVLKKLQAQGMVRCAVRGKNAVWEKVGKPESGNNLLIT
jgi:DNA-binding HxlR family transcriptional regulator